ncbi:MAG: hypothetical protein ACREDR_11085 [Blastocatellia bacterium]
MKIVQRIFIPAILLIVAFPISSFADSLQKRIEFEVNGQFSLRMEKYLLPAGHYVLHQAGPNNLNLFALYLNDMTHPPIAMVSTTRIEYPESQRPEHSKMLLDYRESGNQDEPVITGWNLPGYDGWQIIGVFPKNESVLTKVH